jgi:hypothetical protein
MTTYAYPAYNPIVPPVIFSDGPASWNDEQDVTK